MKVVNLTPVTLTVLNNDQRIRPHEDYEHSEMVFSTLRLSSTEGEVNIRNSYGKRIFLHTGSLTVREGEKHDEYGRRVIFIENTD